MEPEHWSWNGANPRYHLFELCPIPSKVILDAKSKWQVLLYCFLPDRRLSRLEDGIYQLEKSCCKEKSQKIKIGEIVLSRLEVNLTWKKPFPSWKKSQRTQFLSGERDEHSRTF